VSLSICCEHVILRKEIFLCVAERGCVVSLIHTFVPYRTLHYLPHTFVGEHVRPSPLSKKTKRVVERVKGRYSMLIGYIDRVG
jgi:hypothetical protein